MTKDDRITVKERKEIPDGCIHIYPGKKMGVGLSRSFTVWLEKLGYRKLKRREGMKYDHMDFPTRLSVLDDSFMISIHPPDTEGVGDGSFLHNFMIVHIPKNIATFLKERFPNKMRTPMIKIRPIPVRNPRVIHIEFDLSQAIVIDKLLYDAREVFA